MRLPGSVWSQSGLSSKKLLMRNDVKTNISNALDEFGVAILPPMDAFSSMRLLSNIGFLPGDIACTILDPWYNKGVGGVLPENEYDAFIKELLNLPAEYSDTIYLWGFPEIIGPYVRYAPNGFNMVSWLMWYYKNCPSVIRGWRSSQNACIQFMRNGVKQHPENFLEGEQLKKYQSGKMRFVHGPSSVIEEPLIIGFVGKKERTGHPAQKPEKVFQKLILMSSMPGDIVFDPMAGSGTTGAAAMHLERKAILCDMNEEYIQLMEQRLGVHRIQL